MFRPALQVLFGECREQSIVSEVGRFTHQQDFR
jgi:hypothetical protein